MVMQINERYLADGYLSLALKRLSQGKCENMITFLDYMNLDLTSNHVERTNRWFRKRQKTHYRNRKERTIRNMLKVDLSRWSDHSGQPDVRLKQRSSPAQAIEAA
jgi:hypothetical protein